MSATNQLSRRAPRASPTSSHETPINSPRQSPRDAISPIVTSANSPSAPEETIPEETIPQLPSKDICARCLKLPKNKEAHLKYCSDCNNLVRRENTAKGNLKRATTTTRKPRTILVEPAPPVDNNVEILSEIAAALNDNTDDVVIIKRDMGRVKTDVGETKVEIEDINLASSSILNRIEELEEEMEKLKDYVNKLQPQQAKPAQIYVKRQSERRE